MSQLNRNLNYLTVVDGNTPWEKLRVIRNFLEDRRMALALGELGLEKAEATIDKDSWEWKEHQIRLPQALGNLEDARREIKFLEDVEARLIPMAEADRIEGKTDEEMYELNFPRESAESLALEAQAEIAAVGHISVGTMKQIICNKYAVNRAIELELLAPAALQIAAKFPPLLPAEIAEE
jgi:hypothetical protein